MQKLPYNGSKLISSNINSNSNKPVSRSSKFQTIFSSHLDNSQQPQQPPSTAASAIPQQYPTSNIPTHKTNFQQTLPRYNPPPQPVAKSSLPPASSSSSNNNNNNHHPTVAQRRLIPHRGRYSTGTTASSLIPSPGNFLHHQHHPPLISPALSTLSAASTIQSQESIQTAKSHLIAYSSSRIPGEMLKFQVRKSDVTDSPATPQASSIGSANAQIQVSI